MLTLLLFVFIVILLFWVIDISGRLKSIEQALAKGKAGLSHSASGSLASRSVEFPTQTPGLIPEESIPQPPSMPASPVSAAVAKPQSRRSDSEVEAQIATNWLNKIGVVALLLGMVFFFKYAVDQGWITPWMRIIIGFLVGGLLVFLGELWKEKYGKWSHALSGGGVALLYFTIFAAYQFYGIMSQPVAFVLMLAVAGLSVWLSFRYSSLVLGVLGFFGAYGAPVMLSSGRDQQVPLFAYLSILNITALVILVKRYWMELLILALCGTVFNFAIWAASYSGIDNSLTSLSFIIITLVLYVIGSALLVRFHHLKNNLSAAIVDRLGIFYLLAGGFFIMSIIFLLGENHRDMLAPVALFGGILYLFSYALVDRLEFRNVNYSLALAGSLLLVLAAGWQYNGQALALVWMGLGLLGVVLGVLLKREELRVWSLVVLFLSLAKTVTEPYAPGASEFLFNAKFGLMSAQTAALLLASWVFGKVEIKELERQSRSALQAAAGLLFWFAVSWEIVRYFEGSAATSAMNLWLSLWWLAYAVVLIAIGGVLRNSGLRKLAIILFGVSIVKVFLYDVQALDTAYRIISFIVLGVILLSVSFVYQRNKARIMEFLEGEKQ